MATVRELISFRILWQPFLLSGGDVDEISGANVDESRLVLHAIPHPIGTHPLRLQLAH